jgi:hypothetical protein
MIEWGYLVTPLLSVGSRDMECRIIDYVPVLQFARKVNAF